VALVAARSSIGSGSMAHRLDFDWGLHRLAAVVETTSMSSYYTDSYKHTHIKIVFFVFFTDGFECPACRKLLNMDRDNVLALPKNLALENIVARYVEERRRSMCLSQVADVDVAQVCRHSEDCGTVASATCDLCDTAAGLACRAVWFCSQCSVAYCTACLSKFHPQRGALARHNIRSVVNDGTQANDGGRLPHCGDHSSELASMFCDRCKVYVCHLCVCDGEGRHAGHKMLLPETACTMVKVLLLVVGI